MMIVVVGSERADQLFVQWLRCVERSKRRLFTYKQLTHAAESDLVQQHDALVVVTQRGEWIDWRTKGNKLR
jgi:hypothetical protein